MSSELGAQGSLVAVLLVAILFVLLALVVMGVIFMVRLDKLSRRIAELEDAEQGRNEEHKLFLRLNQ